jgi:hypothetical protein
MNTTVQSRASLLHRIATSLGISNYTIDDVIRVAQKKGVREATVTALKTEYPLTEDRHAPGEYQPVVVLAGTQMKVGMPVSVDFNPVEGLPGPMDLRHQIIKGKQLNVEKILHEYKGALSKSGITVDYRDFDRTY